MCNHLSNETNFTIHHPMQCRGWKKTAELTCKAVIMVLMHEKVWDFFPHGLSLFTGCEQTSLFIPSPSVDTACISTTNWTQHWVISPDRKGTCCTFLSGKNCPPRRERSAFSVASKCRSLKLGRRVVRQLRGLLTLFLGPSSWLTCGLSAVHEYPRAFATGGRSKEVCGWCLIKFIANVLQTPEKRKDSWNESEDMDKQTFQWVKAAKGYVCKWVLLFADGLKDLQKTKYVYYI